MENLYIKIEATEQEEGGFMYGIYDEPEMEGDEIDGGHCTSHDIKDAIEMACDMAKQVASYKQE